MDIDEAARRLDEALRGNEVITVYCECSVRYSGRAESRLGQGERLVVIKQDNSVLIHQPTDSTPVNYMKQGSSVNVSVEDGELVVACRKLSDKDYLDITMTRVLDVSSHKLRDGKSLELVGTEEDMSDHIRDNPGVVGEWFRPMEREEHTDHGFIDVFGHDASGRLVIVECKRYTAGVSAVQQLRRYVERVQRDRGVGEEKVRGVLAAPEIASKAQDMLEDWSFEYTRVEPPHRAERFDKAQQSLDDF